MKRLIPFLSFLLVLASCAKEPAEVTVPSAPPQEEQQTQDPFLIPGTVIVKLSDSLIGALEGAASPVETRSTGFNAISEVLNVTSVERVFPDGGRFDARHREAGLHRWYRIRYDGSVPATKAVGELDDLDGVLAVETPRRKEMKRFSYFNDPYSYYQWHYYNDGSQGTGFRKGADINVVPVWEQFTTGSSDVIVAVIDSGVDPSHEDLAPVVIPAGEGGSRNFASVHGEYEIEPMTHGTHVAGTIAAVNGNGIGVCGVAGGRDGEGGVRILSCAIFASGPEGKEVGGDEAAALVWAADHGAVIANNSWGYKFEQESQARAAAESFATNESALKTAIDYFIDYAGLDENGNQTGPVKGGVVLFSSGNEGWAYDVPAMYEKVVAVGAIQHDNSIASYSNYGDWVDLMAPGGADGTKVEQFVLSTTPDNKYGWAVGTSMACPHAAGVAALLASYFGGPGFTAAQLTERLVWGAKAGVIDTKGRNNGGGRLDAYGSFTYSGRIPVSFTTDYDGDFSFRSHESETITYRISGNDDGRMKVESRGGEPVITAECSDTRAVFKVDALKGVPGTYTCTVTVGRGTMFEKSLDLTVEVLENHAPKTKAVFSDTVLDAETGESIDFNLGDYFSDEDGETLSFTAETTSGGTASAGVSAGVLTVKAQTYGQAGITVTGRDARGESVKQAFTLLARDTSKAVDLYPNPVNNLLYVRPEHDAQVGVAFYDRAGAKVLDQTVESKLFNPAKVDVKGLPAGVYTVKVTLDGKESSMTIVKI